MPRVPMSYRSQTLKNDDSVMILPHPMTVSVDLSFSVPVPFGAAATANPG